MVSYPPLENLERLAIDAALSCQWEKALEYNKEIKKTEPENVECLNRLAKAYFELGKYLQAKKIYQEVLKLDPYNLIAQKNLKKAGAFKKNAGAKNIPIQVAISPSLFLEEPGITKLVSLIKVAEPQRLLTLSAGSLVNLIPKNRGISVTDGNNLYLGVLPDDTAHHLLKLIKGGNKYQALIKSVKPNGLTLLVRETFRSKKFKNQPSFLDNAKILIYSSHNIPLDPDSLPLENDDSLTSEELNQ
ncbi:tetratricopeptide repeat protein [Candidatus Daviesbacteria bacterium]|nr:tetratricopeptide repeat protein [Candidatus Daviesbacteria bacterium]